MSIPYEVVNLYTLEHQVSVNLPTVVAFSSVNTPKGRFKPYRLVLDSGINAIFVNVPRNNWYQEGIPGISEDAKTSAIILIKRARQIGNGKVITFGSSMGAFGAILYADLGDADGCLAFGAENPLGLEGGRYLMHYRGNGHTPYSDISAHINERTAYFTCEKDEVDLMSALSVSKCPGYRHSFMGMEHPGLQYLEKDGRHSRIINEYAKTNTITEPVGEAGWALDHPDLVTALYECKLLKENESSEWLPSIKAVAGKWEHPTAFLRLGEAYRKVGQIKEARSAWEHCISLSTQEGVAFQKLGALADTPLEEALIYFRKSIEIDGLNAYAHFGLAETLRKLKDPHNAELSYRSAVRRNSGNRHFRETFANFLISLGIAKIEEGRKLLMKK